MVPSPTAGQTTTTLAFFDHERVGQASPPSGFAVGLLLKAPATTRSCLALNERPH